MLDPKCMRFMNKKEKCGALSVIDKKALHVLYSKYTTYPLYQSDGQRTYEDLMFFLMPTYGERREVLSGVLIFLIISPIDVLMQ